MTCKRIFALLLLLCLLCCGACSPEDAPIRLSDTVNDTATASAEAEGSDLISSDPAVDTIPTKTCSHKNTVLENVAAASCTADGYSGDTVCSNCGAILEEGSPIPSTGHSLSIKNEVEADCENPGYTGDEYCTVCGEILEAGKTVPAAGHRVETVNAKNADCTTDGYTGDKCCTVCGETIGEGSKIPATGHSKTKTVNEKAATETSEGYTGDVVCGVCGAVVTKGSKTAKITTRSGGNSGHGDSTMVWIPTKGGKKYHSKSTCSGMIDPEYVTLEEAYARGFTDACKRCH